MNVTMPVFVIKLTQINLFSSQLKVEWEVYFGSGIIRQIFLFFWYTRPYMIVRIVKEGDKGCLCFRTENLVLIPFILSFLLPFKIST